MWSPRQVTHLPPPLCGIFYVPWHRHRIELQRDKLLQMIYGKCTLLYINDIWQVYFTVHNDIWKVYFTVHNDIWKVYFTVHNDIWKVYFTVHNDIWKVYFTGLKEEDVKTETIPATTDDGKSEKKKKKAGRLPLAQYSCRARHSRWKR